jgi:pilus assembly protein CpaC
MKLFLFAILMTSHTLFSQDLPEDKKKEIEIVLGIDRFEKLDFAPSPKVQVGNETILTYQLVPQKREIAFKGLKPGQTSLIIRDTVGDIKARYLVTITENDLSKVVQELKDYLGDIEGIEIGIKGNSVYVGGEIIVAEKMGLINTILKSYPKVLPLVELSPQSQKIVAEKMQAEINKSSGLKEVTVRVVNKIYWIEGVVTNSGDKNTAQKIAEAYLPDRLMNLAERTDSVQQITSKPIIQNFISVNEKKQEEKPPKLIKITAQFVELTKDYAKTFGFRWTPTFGELGGSINIGKTANGGVTTNSSDSTLAATLSNLFPKLRSAREAGHARVIQSGTVLVESGIQGSLSKTTKKQFSLGSNEFTRASQATAGFDMKVKPQALGEELIKLEMGINVSATIGNPPDELTNAISSVVTVKNNETVVFGGVAVNKTKTDYDRLPRDNIEGGSPLFEFVRSKSLERDRSQFVVFVTPQVIESASEGTEEIKRKFRQEGGP